MGRALRGGLSQSRSARSHSRHGDRAGEGGNATRRRRWRERLSIRVRALRLKEARGRRHKYDV